MPPDPITDAQRTGCGSATRKLLFSITPQKKDNTLVQPNYQYEKRQKDLAKKKKKEEKQQRKLDKTGTPSTEPPTPGEGETTPAAE